MRNLVNEERRVISHMRTAIAHLDSDPSIADEYKYYAHLLFSHFLIEWDEPFAELYNKMLRICDAKTPHPRGRSHCKHIAVGYSSLEITEWVADKIQPPVPTAIELLKQFDQLIVEYTGTDTRTQAEDAA